MKILALEGDYSVYRYAADSPLPKEALGNAPFSSVVRTDEELSVVRPSGELPGAEKEEEDWTLWKIEGPLDFGMIGVLASVTKPLAEAGVSVFTLSTFDTDYILWKKDKAAAAVRALRSAGFEVEASARFP